MARTQRDDRWALQPIGAPFPTARCTFLKGEQNMFVRPGAVVQERETAVRTRVQ